jgi:hypothetical protein
MSMRTNLSHWFGPLTRIDHTAVIALQVQGRGCAYDTGERHIRRRGTEANGAMQLPRR